MSFTTTWVSSFSSSSQWQYAQSKKPGGIFVITGEQMKYRITQSIKEKVGRWAGNIYILKNNNTIASMSMHEFGNKSITRSLSSYSQQVAWLQEHHQNINPRRAHRHDLIEEATIWKQKFNHMLIADNFNKHNYTSGLLLDLQKKLGMVAAINILSQSAQIRGN
jgi:hypothetical protein